MTWSRSRSASTRRRRSSAILAASLLALLGAAQVSKVRVAGNGDGTYNNPVLHADYSGPDAETAPANEAGYADFDWFRVEF